MKKFIIGLSVFLATTVAYATIMISGQIGTDGISIGEPGVRIPSGMSSSYAFYTTFGSGKDQVSGQPMQTTLDTARPIDMDSGVLVGEDEPTIANGALLTYGAFTQLCQDSEDPGDWTSRSGATISANGEDISPFKGYNIISAGGAIDNFSFWQSVDTAPTATLYFSIFYNTGTSGRIRVIAKDNDDVDTCTYRGVIGSASSTEQNAGTLTIISDEYDSDLGYYILKGSILFDTLTNELYLGIGPDTANNGETIKILGAGVSESITILNVHVPSSDSNVPVPLNYSDATHGYSWRINPDEIGSVYTGKVVGSELHTSFTNGDFNTHTVNGTGFTAANTTSTANENNYAGITCVIGKTYKAFYDLTINSGATPIIKASTDIALTTDDAYSAAVVEGGETISFIATGTTMYVGFKSSTAAATNFTVADSVSVKEVSRNMGTPLLLDALDGAKDGTELVTNGDMELDSNWQGYSSPTSVARSSEQAHSGTYSQKFVSGGDYKGIEQTDASRITVTAGQYIEATVYIYPVDVNVVRLQFREGDNSDYALNEQYTGLILSQWNKITVRFTISVSGALGRFRVQSGSAGDGTWYVDDVTVQVVKNAPEYISDFSAGVNGWTGVRCTVAGSIDSIGGQDANLRATLTDGQSSHYFRIDKSDFFDRDVDTSSLKLSVYIPSTNSKVDGFAMWENAVGYIEGYGLDGAGVGCTQDAWIDVDINPINFNGYFHIRTLEGSSPTVDADGDVIYVRAVELAKECAQGQLEVEWTPLYDYGDTALTENILAVNEASAGLLYHTNMGYLRTYDLTNVAQKDIDYQSGTRYKIYIMWGTHPTEGANKFQIVVTDGSTIWESTIEDFDGSFNPGDYFNLAWENEYPQLFHSIKCLKAPEYGTW